MPGTITLADGTAGGTAVVMIANPGKFNAIDIGMWGALRALFERLQALPAADAPRVVLIRGDAGQFASGGDIAEFADFRFDEARLRDFHEHIVAPALHAMLACEIPLLAGIEGNCIGGGLEIACCCDLRVAAAGSRFGAPIGKLGFPMAPLELQVVARVAPGPVLREMLLEARLLDADAALRHGLVHAVLPGAELETHLHERAARIAALSPQAARFHKRTLRQIESGGPSDAQRHAAYAYADSAEHREGIAAFIEKRPPRFQRG
jgi:enoyl-CoA hydratase